MNNIPVILSGGSGTRLWPLSRKCHPKQLLEFNGNDSLLQSTLKRISLVKGLSKPIIVCSDAYRFSILDQLNDIGSEIDTLIIEPEGHNTAPSIALAALHCLEIDKGSRLFIFPSDHFVENEEEFCAVIERLCHEDINDKIVTLGITPLNPDTGFGYIKVGKPVQKDIYQVSQFVEKPALALAENYVKSKEYLWNSGIFISAAATLVSEFKKYSSDIIESCKNSLINSVRGNYIEVNKDYFSQCPIISFDHAVMEQTDKAVVMPVNLGWNDLGNWRRVWESSKKDNNNNVIKGEAIALETQNCYIWGGDRSLMVTIGLDNLIIIQTPDVCLIANKDSLDQLNAIMEQLKLENRKEILVNKKMYRPWGYYESIIENPRYQVKRVIVTPGEKLSLQLHYHRSEHWVVVKGTGKVTRGEEEIIISENESTYIPCNTKHRIENIGKIDLELIEVQVGSYLGEDDIVRFEDKYGRKE